MLRGSSLARESNFVKIDLIILNFVLCRRSFNFLLQVLRFKILYINLLMINSRNSKTQLVMQIWSNFEITLASMSEITN